MIVPCALPTARSARKGMRMAAFMSPSVDARKGPTLRSALSCFGMALVLRGEHADPRRPVGECGARAGPMIGAAARTQDVVTAAAREERAAPVGVVAGVGDVLAGDPDRVPVPRGCAVVAPPRPRWV